MSWATLCERHELTPGEGKPFEIDGHRIAVFIEPETLAVHAIDDTCPHARGSLGFGWVDRGCAVCPLHGWAFGLTDGAMRGSPGVKIRVYPVRERTLADGRVMVQVELPGF